MMRTRKVNINSDKLASWKQNTPKIYWITHDTLALFLANKEVALLKSRGDGCNRHWCDFGVVAASWCNWGHFVIHVSVVVDKC